MKVLYIDTETGGLNTEKAALLQLSGIVEIDGEVKEEFNFFIKPFENAEVTEEALKVQGRTFEDLKDEKYQDEKVKFEELKKILDRYVDKYDRADKFVVAGYNVEFDIKILQAFFKRQNDNYLFAYIKGQYIDPLKIIPLLQYYKIIPELENNKLETWCKHFGIDFEAHDSLEDIRATRKIIKELYYFVGR